MRRAPMMRNAPTVDVQRPATRNTTTQPAAPAISALQQRMQNMAGDSVTLHINGRDILFKLRVIVADAVERATSVYNGNERDQSLLNENSLADILPTIREAGQQFPAIGRDVCGIVEVADGSRRRAAVILAGRSYRVLVGDLTEEDMQWLTRLGNDYTPPSAYERGKRYARLLQYKYDGKLSRLAEGEGVSRRLADRYVRMAALPIEVIKAFAVPNDLSMKSGEALAALLPDYSDKLIAVATDITERRNTGENIDVDDVLAELHAVVERKEREKPTVREYGKGVKAVCKGGKMVIHLQDVPVELARGIEKLLEQHKLSQVAEGVNSDLDSLQDMLALIRKAAEVRGCKLTSNEELALVYRARQVTEDAIDEDDKINKIGALIERNLVK